MTIRSNSRVYSSPGVFWLTDFVIFKIYQETSAAQASGVFASGGSEITSIKDIVKSKNARFVYFRDKALFYETDDGFQFPIPIDDAGSATFNAEEKAILLMRYIRKHKARTEEARAEQNNADV